MYYINPWVFYIVSLISNIQFVSVLFLFVGGFAWVIAILVVDSIIESKEQADDSGN